MTHHKQIKLQPKYRYRRYEYHPDIVPELRMSGKWLAAAGFTPGEYVTIEVSDNQLIIKKGA